MVVTLSSRLPTFYSSRNFFENRLVLNRNLYPLKRFLFLFCSFALMIGCAKPMGKNLNRHVTLIHSFNCDFFPPASLLVFPDAVYILNIETEMGVIKYDFKGEKLFSFGGKGEGPGEFIFPNNIYFDYEQNLIGITDVALKRTTFMDTLGNFVKVDKFENPEKSPMMSGIFNVRKSIIEFSTMPTSSEKKLAIKYQIAVKNKNYYRKIMERTYPIHRDISQNTIKIATLNENQIFFAELQSKTTDFQIDIFDHQGEKKLWKPKWIPSKVQSMNTFQVSRNYLFINSRLSSGKRIYLIYDFAGNYIGFLEFENGDIIEIYDEKMFVISEENDNTMMKIYDFDF